MEEVIVLIVGAGPAGLATAACLSQSSIPYVIVEREDCSAPLWRKHMYDRLNLHLAKEFCELPHMSYPIDAPTYISKNTFVKYLDDYIECFNTQPRYLTIVESSTYAINGKYWSIVARDMAKCTIVNYRAKFLVVASGENSAENIPMVPGLENFLGVTIHSSSYKSGINYSGRNVLVVGSGNSGMEIAYDLASHGANTSIVIRSPFHVMTKELTRLGMTLVHHLPVKMVDNLLVMLANFKFGDLSRYGIKRPKKGPFALKSETGRSSVIDVGTIDLIKKGNIKVKGSITNINGKTIEFQGGNEGPFDAIVFATGYKSTVNMWLKNDEDMLNSEGFPKNEFPDHWKGRNMLYCAGFARRGLAVIATDAKNIANDIKWAVLLALYSVYHSKLVRKYILEHAAGYFPNLHAVIEMISTGVRNCESLVQCSRAGDIELAEDTRLRETRGLGESLNWLAHVKRLEAN